MPRDTKRSKKYRKAKVRGDRFRRSPPRTEMDDAKEADAREEDEALREAVEDV